MPHFRAVDCDHFRSERCLLIDEIWYRVCQSCGSTKADGPRDPIRSVERMLTRIKDRDLIDDPYFP